MPLKDTLKRLLPQKMQDLVRVWRFPSNRFAFFNSSLTYRADGLATSHNFEFAQEPLFQHSYALGEQTGSWGSGDLRWRAHTICWAAQWASRLPGDFVECGVNKGGYARMVVNYVSFPRLKKTFYLLDTFRGLAEAYISAEERQLGRTAGGYTECYEEVVATFRPFQECVRIIRGPVPDTLPQVQAERVCFLSIDMNNALPEIAAAEYFWDKLVPGAVVVLDDYGHASHLPQKRAFDAFAARKGVGILTLPTSQGLLFKPQS